MSEPKYIRIRQPEESEPNRLTWTEISAAALAFGGYLLLLVVTL